MSQYNVKGYRLRADRAWMKVQGEDAWEWLNRQITADASDLKPGRDVYALLLTPKGKILADVRVYRLEDEAEQQVAWLSVPASQAALLMEHLDKYIIMEDVELEVMEHVAEMSIFPIASPLPQTTENVAKRSRFRADLSHSIHDEAQCWAVDRAEVDSLCAELEQNEMHAISDKIWSMAHIHRGIPQYGIDFDEKRYPQEAGLKSGVSFNKGCYLGQEVVCMLENRGQLVRNAVQLSIDAAEGTTPTAGDTLLDEQDQTRGEITSVCAVPDAPSAYLALGYVKRALAVEGQELKCASGAVRVLSLVEPG